MSPYTAANIGGALGLATIALLEAAKIRKARKYYPYIFAGPIMAGYLISDFLSSLEEDQYHPPLYR